MSDRDEPARPRKRPCASCPYRRDAPSGVWDDSEYQKLPRYDADTANQPTAVFACHHDDGSLCAGWLGHSDPIRLLALRLAVMSGTAAPECADYSTTVPLFASGAEAAAHGMRDLEQPGEKAHDTIRKLTALRNLYGSGTDTER